VAPGASPWGFGPKSSNHWTAGDSWAVTTLAGVARQPCSPGSPRFDCPPCMPPTFGVAPPSACPDTGGLAVAGPVTPIAPGPKGKGPYWGNPQGRHNKALVRAWYTASAGLGVHAWHTTADVGLHNRGLGHSWGLEHARYTAADGDCVRGMSSHRRLLGCDPGVVCPWCTSAAWGRLLWDWTSG